MFMPVPEFRNKSLELQPEAVVLLDETRKWGKFLAVLGFIAAGFMIILGVLSLLWGDSMALALPISPMFILLFYIIVALIYLFPSLYLYKFAEKSKRAVADDNPTMLTGSFDSLRDCFRFLGVTSIVFLVMYALGIIITIISLLFFSDMIPDSYTMLLQSS